MNAQQNAFFQLAVPAAQRTQRKYGVPASITIAQAILESGWGQSKLALECNNFFGIKDADHCDYKEFPTREDNGGAHIEIARFESYKTPADCFAEHARLLLTRRYAPAMAVRNDPAKFAAQLQACGYSTNPNYASSLMRLVEQYDLTQYDIAPETPAKEQA